MSNETERNPEWCKARIAALEAEVEQNQSEIDNAADYIESQAARIRELETELRDQKDRALNAVLGLQGRIRALEAEGGRVTDDDHLCEHRHAIFEILCDFGASNECKSDVFDRIDAIEAEHYARGVQDGIGRVRQAERDKTSAPVANGRRNVTEQDR